MAASYVNFYIANEVVVALADGSLYVDGWNEWQEGDVTVKERMARLRNRHRNNGVTEGTAHA